MQPLGRPSDTSSRSPRSRLALAAVKAVSWGGLLGVLVASGAVGAPFGTPDRGAARAEARSDSGTDGVDGPGGSAAGAVQGPDCAAALIRTTDGEVRRVAFRVGWDVYTGRRPGTLLAACLDAGVGAQ